MSDQPLTNYTPAQADQVVRKTCCICGALLTNRACQSCGHPQCSKCPVYVPAPTIAELQTKLDHAHNAIVDRGRLLDRLTLAANAGWVSGSETQRKVGNELATWADDPDRAWLTDTDEIVEVFNEPAVVAQGWLPLERAEAVKGLRAQVARRGGLTHDRLATNMRNSLMSLCDVVDGWQKKCADVEAQLVLAQQQVARLSGPVSDVEWNAALHKVSLQNVGWHGVATAMLASRTAPAKERP